jgi:hypothetical protein
MIVALSFIGPLPPYIVDCIFQLRLFFDGHIYLIIDDLDSPHLTSQVLKNIHLVPYEEVKTSYLESYRKHFPVVDQLHGRTELFYRSFERFFLLQNAMKKYGLEDVFFMELDNMMYFDPREFAAEFSKSKLCYMVDDVDRASSVFMYIKSADSLTQVLQFGVDYIEKCHRRDFLSEMQMLYRFYNHVIRNIIPGYSAADIQILPSFWRPVNWAEELVMPVAQHFCRYNGVFDPQPIGIYLCGIDRYHSGGKLQTGRKSDWTKMDYTPYKYEWRADDQGRKIPHVIDESGRALKIYNLHVHSKELHLGASIPMQG